MKKKTTAQSNQATIDEKVLAIISASGDTGLTREEIEDASGISGNSVRPSVVKLLADKSICLRGTKRPTRSGRSAAVLVRMMKAAPVTSQDPDAAKTIEYHLKDTEFKIVSPSNNPISSKEAYDYLQVWLDSRIARQDKDRLVPREAGAVRS